MSKFIISWLSVRRIKHKLLQADVEYENEQLYEVTNHI